MGADHNTLDALRRLAKDRAATPAEKATARHLAKTLAAKIGKSPRRSWRRGQGAALPEPPAARWRRQWITWIEAAFHKIWLAGRWVHGIWIVSLVAVVLVMLFGSEAVRRLVAEVYLVRTLGLVAAALAMMTLGGLLTFVALWLRTWRNERLRSALVFLAEHVPWFAMLAAGIGVSVYLEGHSKWPHLLRRLRRTADSRIAG